MFEDSAVMITYTILLRSNHDLCGIPIRETMKSTAGQVAIWASTVSAVWLVVSPLIFTLPCCPSRECSSKKCKLICLRTIGGAAILFYGITILTLVGKLSLTTTVFVNGTGPELDANPDGAIFAYQRYHLSIDHKIAVFNDKDHNQLVAESREFDEIYNRLYLGTFNEFLNKYPDLFIRAIPCETVMPFFANASVLNDFLAPGLTQCDVLFSMQLEIPGDSHGPSGTISVSTGLRVFHGQSCSTQSLERSISGSDFFTDVVHQDVTSYLCDVACGSRENICPKPLYSELEYTYHPLNSRDNVTWAGNSLIIHDLEFSNECEFGSIWEKEGVDFCDEPRRSVEAEPVPAEMARYPQFIPSKGDCNNLWL